MSGSDAIANLATALKPGDKHIHARSTPAVLTAEFRVAAAREQKLRQHFSSRMCLWGMFCGAQKRQSNIDE